MSKFFSVLLSLYSRSELFVVWLLVAICAAWLLPSLPSFSPLPSLSSLNRYGIVVIFFLYGASLSWRELLGGILHRKFHILVTATTFLAFPLMVLAMLPLVVPLVGDRWGVGLFFLATLPSTVSSSLMMVTLARGNVPAALVSTTLSSILGIVVTPLWLSFFFWYYSVTRAGEASLAAQVAITTLVILLPTALGLVVSRWIGAWVRRHRHQLRMFDQTVVLSIVYCAFATVFVADTHTAISWQQLTGLIAILVLLFAVIFVGVGSLACLAGLDSHDKIAAQICASQKSLLHATGMGQLLFAPVNATVGLDLGLILLPMMLYHAIQLLSTGAILSLRTRVTRFREVRADD